MSSAPRFAPSSLNWTPATPTLSELVAETRTAVPDTVAPFAGAVMATVGAVTSFPDRPVRVKYVLAGAVKLKVLFVTAMSDTFVNALVSARYNSTVDSDGRLFSVTLKLTELLVFLPVIVNCPVDAL